MSVTLGQLIQFMEHRYPPATAESWDRVGLVVGNRSQPFSRVLLAVDPVPEVVAEARGYDLSGQRARQLLCSDFLGFDWILVMDADNERAARTNRCTV